MSDKKMKPRNHVVLAMIRSNKQSVAHGKTFKALRRENKVKLKSRGTDHDGK
jgi:hypothetical protein